jgi:hypothetical protein
MTETLKATTTALARHYAELYRRVKRAEASLAEVVDEKNTLQAELLERYAEEGIQSIKLPDGPTVYLSGTLWAGRADGVGKLDAVAALKQHEATAVFVEEGFNTSSVSALFREWDKAAREKNKLGESKPDGEPWTLWDFAPPGLSTYLKASTQYAIKVTGGS